MGRAGVMYALARNTFWAPAKRGLDLVIVELAALVDAGQVPQICERLHAARCAYYEAFSGWGIPERTIRALNADHSKKTWDGAFGAARAKI